MQNIVHLVQRPVASLWLKELHAHPFTQPSAHFCQLTEVALSRATRI